MQFPNRAVPCCRKTGMAGLGIWETLAAGAASALMSDSAGGATGGAGTAITVSPPITVSPQISPVFQQSFQPTNSPMTAGASQVSPGMSPGGAALPTGFTAPATGSIPMPAVAPVDQLQKYLPWVLGALGIVVVMRLVTQRKRVVAKRHKRASKAA